MLKSFIDLILKYMATITSSRNRDLSDLGNGFLAASTAVQRPIEEKLGDVISVKDFGAVGDFSQDDTAAIQAAIDYVESLGELGSVLYIPAGLYRITAPLRTGKQYSIRIVGDGVAYTTIVQTTPDANGIEHNYNPVTITSVSGTSASVSCLYPHNLGPVSATPITINNAVGSTGPVVRLPHAFLGPRDIIITGTNTFDMYVDEGTVVPTDQTGLLTAPYSRPIILEKLSVKCGSLPSLGYGSEGQGGGTALTIVTDGYGGPNNVVVSDFTAIGWLAWGLNYWMKGIEIYNPTLIFMDRVRLFGQFVANTPTLADQVGLGLYTYSASVAGALGARDGAYGMFFRDVDINYFTLAIDLRSEQQFAGGEFLNGKTNARAATTANITLSGTQTIDGVALNVGDRVLVKNQTNLTENGIYNVASGAWTRSTDAGTYNDLLNALVFITEGTTEVFKTYLCTAPTGGTLGTTLIRWLPWAEIHGLEGVYFDNANILTHHLCRHYSNIDSLQREARALQFKFIGVSAECSGYAYDLDSVTDVDITDGTLLMNGGEKGNVPVGEGIYYDISRFKDCEKVHISGLTNTLFFTIGSTPGFSPNKKKFLFNFTGGGLRGNDGVLISNTKWTIPEEDAVGAIYCASNSNNIREVNTLIERYDTPFNVPIFEAEAGAVDCYSTAYMNWISGSDSAATYVVDNQGNVVVTGEKIVILDQFAIGEVELYNPSVNGRTFRSLSSLDNHIQVSLSGVDTAELAGYLTLVPYNNSDTDTAKHPSINSFWFKGPTNSGLPNATIRVNYVISGKAGSVDNPNTP